MGKSVAYRLSISLFLVFFCIFLYLSISLCDFPIRAEISSISFLYFSLSEFLSLSLSLFLSCRISFCVLICLFLYLYLSISLSLSLSLSLTSQFMGKLVAYRLFIFLSFWVFLYLSLSISNKSYRFVFQHYSKKNFIFADSLTWSMTSIPIANTNSRVCYTTAASSSTTPAAAGLCSAAGGSESTLVYLIYKAKNIAVWLFFEIFFFYNKKLLKIYSMI